MAPATTRATTTTTSALPTTGTLPGALANTSEHVYYDISGTTAGELRAAMDANRLRDPNEGLAGDARTDWRINWNWPGYGRRACTLAQAQVTYEVTVTMPRWTPPPGASTDLIAQWQGYTQSLETHEQGHVDNLMNGYAAVKTAIQGATCDNADAAAQAVLDLIDQADISYDAETDHGTTQGTVFP